jgi:hypothetical protein
MNLYALDIIIISGYNHLDMQKSYPLFLILVLTAVILAPGCTSSTGTRPTTTAAMTTPPPPESATPASIQTTATNTPVITLTALPDGITTSAPVEVITLSPVASSANDPYQEYLHGTVNYLYIP